MASEDLFDEQLDPEQLKDAEEMTFSPLAANYAKTLIISNSLGWGFAALITATVMTIAEGNVEMFFSRYWLLAVFLVPIIIGFIVLPIIARSRGYAVTEGDIHYKSGIIWQKVISLPYNRIQHVQQESGPLERFYKLTSLKFFTAGGGSADLTIPALTFEHSAKLRSFVLDKAGVSDSAEDMVHD